jgi:NADPH:quinone reductase-like Zn-dependent oxidoreductase
VSDEMRAGTASETGLQICEVSRPQVGDQQVLVRVHASGVNRADLNAASGAGVASRSAWGHPIGMEWAGEVVELGANAHGIKVGDLVVCTGTRGLRRVRDRRLRAGLAPAFKARDHSRRGSCPTARDDDGS